jgi:hypothetical protein
MLSLVIAALPVISHFLLLDTCVTDENDEVDNHENDENASYENDKDVNDDDDNKDNNLSLQSMMRPNRDTIEGYFLAGKHMFWLPVSTSSHLLITNSNHALISHEHPLICNVLI